MESITASWQNLLLYSILMMAIGGILIGYLVNAMDNRMARNAGISVGLSKK